MKRIFSRGNRINLFAGIAALFLGVLTAGLLLELRVVVLRIAKDIDRATRPGS